MTQSRAISALWRRTAPILLVALLPAGTCARRPAHARPDNPPSPDTVGTIVGDSISVQGPMSVEFSNGQSRTVLRSGSDVRVKSGQAHIDLVEGGNVTICGPAHFSLLKSGGALTIALDSGTIHAQVEGQPTLTIYTAQIQAHPVAIGGAQDALVGLDAAGTMCVRANRGAVRIEQQLTGQGLLIPQAGDVSIVNGQLETLQTTAGHCVCELQWTAKPPAAVVTEVSALASTEELKKKAAAPKPSTPTDSPALVTSEPVYQVFMPPLQYNAKTTKVEQEYDPKLIVLVRRARVRPTLIFQGKVEGDAIVAQAAPPPAPPKVEPAKRQEEDTTWNRVRTFFHKLWSPTS